MPDLTCPDCNAPWDTAPGTACPNCGLAEEDLQAAAAFAADPPALSRCLPNVALDAGEQEELLRIRHGLPLQ